MLWFTLCLILISVIILRVVNTLNYWKKRNVVHKKSWPLLGDLKDSVLRKRNIGDIIRDAYPRFPGKRYYGTHIFTFPSLFVTDLDLIKRITVKDFDHFVDHMQGADSDAEPLFSQNLLALKGQRWRDMRNTLSPSFTGNKIRTMFPLMARCAKQLNDHFLEKNDPVIEIEAKDLMSRIATDIIATTAFGLECNSLTEENEFYRMGKLFGQNNLFGLVKLMVQMAFPTIAKNLGISQVPKKTVKFFERVIKETLKQREEKKIIRPDMIHILMEARKNQKPVEEGKIEGNVDKEQITIEDIIAQGFLFFLAGFEVVSTTLAHACNELAVNADVQRKLQTEIDNIFKETDGDLDYESLMKMKYLDMVVSETLRKWPATVLLNRQCVLDYKIEASEAHDEPELIVEKGITIFIPIYGIHYDPTYYPNPDKFDPERFNEKNKHNINPYTYLPFGIGPRNCIGSRLALLEAKVVITYLLSEFDIVVVEKTQIPLVLSPKKPGLGPDNFWLGLKKRSP